MNSKQSFTIYDMYSKLYPNLKFKKSVIIPQIPIQQSPVPAIEPIFTPNPDREYIPKPIPVQSKAVAIPPSKPIDNKKPMLKLKAKILQANKLKPKISKLETNNKIETNNIELKKEVILLETKLESNSDIISETPLESESNTVSETVLELESNIVSKKKKLINQEKLKR